MRQRVKAFQGWVRGRYLIAVIIIQFYVYR